VTFLDLRVFLACKCFIFSTAICRKTKKSPLSVICDKSRKGRLKIAHHGSARQNFGLQSYFGRTQWWGRLLIIAESRQGRLKTNLVVNQASEEASRGAVLEYEYKGLSALGEKTLACYANSGTALRR
jgi:hypothetical protein